MQRTSPRPSVEAQALSALYRQADGPRWLRAEGWPGEGDPCSWYGVTCESGRVVELSLPRNRLAGTLPSDIGLLAHLRYLDLADNRLAGRIPAALGNLRHLVTLDLSDNALHGPLPARLRLLRHLRVLDLHGNALRGAIPSSLRDLRALEKLDLSRNRFTGDVPPELGRLMRLVSLSLEDNPLSGPLPLTLVQLKALARFSFNGTNLVEPPDVAFQIWLAGIDDLSHTGARQAEVIAPGRIGLAALAGLSTLDATAATAWLVLLPLLGPLAGPIVGVLSTLGGTAGAGLVARKVYELSRGLTARGVPPDGRAAGDAASGDGPGAVALRAELAEELRKLVWAARPDLPADVAMRLNAIEEILLSILPRLKRPASGERDAYLVRQTIRDYLPEALAFYRALPTDFAVSSPIRGDETAHDELLQQLDLLLRVLREIDARLDQADADRLLIHGRFLREKFEAGDDTQP